MFKKIILSLSAVLLLSSNANASFFEQFIPQNPTYSPYVGIMLVLVFLLLVVFHIMFMLV